VKHRRGKSESPSNMGVQEPLSMYEGRNGCRHSLHERGLVCRLQHVPACGPQKLEDVRQLGVDDAHGPPLRRWLPHRFVVEQHPFSTSSVTLHSSSSRSIVVDPSCGLKAYSTERSLRSGLASSHEKLNDSSCSHHLRCWPWRQLAVPC
jgi:hypothetical protein